MLVWLERLKSRLFDLKTKELQATLDQIDGDKRDISFGSQVRSSVLHDAVCP